MNGYTGKCQAATAHGFYGEPKEQQKRTPEFIDASCQSFFAPYNAKAKEKGVPQHLIGRFGAAVPATLSLQHDRSGGDPATTPYSNTVAVPASLALQDDSSRGHPMRWFSGTIRAG